jgi:hypothetical protein
MRALVTVSKETDNPMHPKCLEIICNLTRFPANNGVITRFEGVVDTLVLAAKFPTPECRISALRSLQNMSADPSSKALLADNDVLSLLTGGSMRSELGCNLGSPRTQPRVTFEYQSCSLRGLGYNQLLVAVTGEQGPCS